MTNLRKLFLGSGSQAQKSNLIEQAKEFSTQKNDGLPFETFLKVDAEYFVTTNIDVQDGIFNGATGTLKAIEYGITTTADRVPYKAWMDFRNPLIGVTSRSTTKAYQLRKNIDLNLVMVGRITRNLSKTGRHGSLQLIRTQIPLLAANGMTIDKSQGSSLKWVCVCVKKTKHRRRKISRERLYVGCSRATSLDGLFIDGIFEPPATPPEDDPVSTEMRRLRKTPFEFSIKFLQDFDNSYYKIYFHNIQSFLLHHADLVADHCAMSR